MKSLPASPLASQPAELVQKALARYREVLEQTFGCRLRGMKLFGSWARGEADTDSDVDVLILIDDMSFDDNREVIGLASDVGMELDLFISPQPLEPGRYRSMVEREHPFFQAIEREGIEA